MERGEDIVLDPFLADWVRQVNALAQEIPEPAIRLTLDEALRDLRPFYLHSVGSFNSGRLQAALVPIRNALWQIDQVHGFARTEITMERYHRFLRAALREAAQQGPGKTLLLTAVTTRASLSPDEASRCLARTLDDRLGVRAGIRLDAFILDRDRAEAVVPSSHSRLLPEQQRVLDALVDAFSSRHVTDAGWVTGRRLRSAQSGAEKQTLQKHIQLLVPEHIEQQGQEPDDLYRPTLEGLLLSAYGDRINALGEQILSFFKKCLADNPDRMRYSWADFKQYIPDLADKDFDLMIVFLSACNWIFSGRWSRGGNGVSPSATWGLPRTIEAIVDCENWNAFVAMRRREQESERALKLPPAYEAIPSMHSQAQTHSTPTVPLPKGTSHRGARVSGPSSRTQIFVSYSHQDMSWLKRLQVHLRPLERSGGINLWDDTRLRPGMEWRKEIEQALSLARFAVLLISADFLASDFIAHNELPPLLEKASRDGTRIFSIIIGPCRYARHEELSKYQAINDPKRPLSALSSHEAEEAFLKLTETIEEYMKEV